MNLTEHFTLEELTRSATAQSLDIDNSAPEAVIPKLRKTAELLEQVRTLLGAPITVSSGYRSDALNKAVGGVRNSQHSTGQAADILCPKFGTPLEVATKISQSAIKFDQLIHEQVNGKDWVHISWGNAPRHQILTINGSKTTVGLA